MSILAWIEDKKRLKLLNAPKYVNPASDSSKGLWTRCDKCGVILYIKHLKENQRVCFGCSYHLQMSSQERVENLLDKNSWRPLDETVSPCDPLEFHDQKDYTDRLQEAQERTGLQDAIQTGSGMVEGIPVALGVMDFDFMGGSMGSVVGEKVTRLIEYATQEGLTLILVCASGGARMQEGVFSLMQMAKISSALQIYQSCANLLYISILTSPTTGGVTASFAMLGDIIFAEPKALIAFAGRRVIEQTLCEDLPEDFQTSEYMLHHGLLDLIVPRRFLRQALSESIRLYKNAPFKKSGRIPFGVQNPITFLIEEKIRRQILANKSNLAGSKSIQSSIYNVKKTELSNKNNTSLNSIQNSTRDTFLDRQSTNKLKRETGEYRDILTSFQTMFTLFSKNVVLPYGGNPHNGKTSNFSAQSLLNPSSLLSHNKTTSLNSEPVESQKNTNTMYDDSNSINQDFLNQSIELAATENIEWRAFYVHQKVSETSGFIEDFLDSSESESKNKNSDTKNIPNVSSFASHSSNQNILFYRSICRNIK